ncbi:HAD-IC family P-type ATPase [Streptomyces phaeochromogenes]|uniref:HAD-IC family P-type ATPase n=1 Tax=Streptomyces phaeochromogenes TaxID=1923 RepID=UPI00386BB4B9|nr:HAD-IC family P-type ATPase [Streptomyces phaeochromogenes]
MEGERRPLTEETRAAVVAASDNLPSQGLRVLAAAWREVSGPRPAQEEAESGLTLLGLVGMLDPPRTEVTDAVGACRRAGIRIVMVTGDHPLTAEAVARRVGIVLGPTPLVVTGARLDTLDQDALDALLAEPSELLLCRVSPEHKMRVVTAFQRRGEMVAVTGDGANDAPALKHADIGVTMGASGTDVAREAASMVLLDDSFASIATAVRLGRSVYQNIRKFLVYVFSSNIGELGPILAATFAGFPLVPISAVQILAIDLGGLQTGIRSIDTHDQRELHRPHRLSARPPREPPVNTVAPPWAHRDTRIGSTLPSAGARVAPRRFATIVEYAAKGRAGKQRRVPSPRRHGFRIDRVLRRP